MTFDASLVKCPACNSRNLLLDDKQGERFCEDCGVLVENTMLDYGAEWTNYESGVVGGNDKSRVGLRTNIMYHDKGLSTDIDWTNRDYSGRPIKNKMGQVYRMRMWQKRARAPSARDKNLTYALKIIQSKGSKLDVPQSNK